MVQRYFEKFPLTEYTSNVAIDITKRTGLLEKVSQNPLVFYPYELDSGERPDHLSYRYYDDQYKTWLIYLTNKIVDPYYEWYLTNEEFERFIIKKYGSLEYARKKIKHYRNDWIDKEKITVSAYNALTPRQKTFWKPVYNFDYQTKEAYYIDKTMSQETYPGHRFQERVTAPRSSSIMAYERKQEDWIVNTNKLISYKVSNTNFNVGEICKLYFDNYNQGTGQVDVVSAINGTVYLNNLTGTYDIEVTQEEVLRKTTSQSFVGDGSTTTYTLTEPLANQNNCIITVDGLVQIPNVNYTITNNILQFVFPPVSNALIEYRNYETDNELYESERFIGSGFQIAYILSNSVDDPNRLLVTIDGLIQIPNKNYELVSNQLRFVDPPVVGSVVEVRNLDFEFIFATSQVEVGDGSTVNFVQDNVIVDPTDVLVTVDGLLQIPNIHYIASNMNVLFTLAPTPGSVIEFRNIIRKSYVKGYIIGTESGTNAAFTSITYLANNIAQDVEVYYKPVTIYDYELEKNEYNKSVRLLDNRYASQAAEELERLMVE